jgi:NADH:ubiquinone oxidoreductase subunit H
VTGAFVNAAISFIRILLSVATLALMLPLIIYFLAITESKFDASAYSRQSFESLVTRAVEVCRRQSIHFQVIRNFPRMVSIFGLVIAVAAFLGLQFGRAIKVVNSSASLFLVLSLEALCVCTSFFEADLLFESDSKNAMLSRAVDFSCYYAAAAVALISGLMFAGTLNAVEIVQAQYDQGTWFISFAPIGLFVFFIVTIVQSDHKPIFVVKESQPEGGDSLAGQEEIRSGLRLIAHYTNRIVFAALGTVVFLGGWLRPFARYHDHLPKTQIEILDAIPGVLLLVLGVYCLRLARQKSAGTLRNSLMTAGGILIPFSLLLSGALFANASVTAGIHGAFWFLVKILGYLYFVLWTRSTSARFPFFIWLLKWEFLIPLSLGSVFAAGVAIALRQELNAGPVLSVIAGAFPVVGLAAWFVHDNEKSGEEGIGYSDGD